MNDKRENEGEKGVFTFACHDKWQVSLNFDDACTNTKAMVHRVVYSLLPLQKLYGVWRRHDGSVSYGAPLLIIPP